MSSEVLGLRSKKIVLLKQIGYIVIAIALTITALLFETQKTSAAPGPVSGTVFNDANANGTKDAGEGSFSNVAIVNLYNSSGTYIKSRTSDASGNFSFSGLAAGTYYVSLYNTTRASLLNSPPGLVDNTNVKVEQTYGSVGAGAGAGSGPICVGASPTYGAKANYTSSPSEWTVGAQNGTSSGQCFGGRKADMTNTVLSALTPLTYPANTDFTTGNAGLNTQKSVSKVVLTTSGGVSNVDFGASVDVVTNTDGSGQGSLNQFITNANNVGGTRTMRFVPSATPSQTNGANKWWQINQGTTALPTITNTATTIDGRAWSNTDGTTQLDTNSGALAGATVGTTNYTIGDYKKPELEIVGDARASGGTALLSVNASTVTIANLGLNSTSNYPSTTSAFVSQTGGVGISVKDNLMGVNVATGANYSTRPQNAIQTNYLLSLNASGSYRHNYISSNDARGMTLSNVVALLLGDWSIEENDGPSAGVSFGSGTTRISVRHNNMPNAWLDAAVIGASLGFHTLTENTVSGGSGVMLLGGSQNTITKNKIQNAASNNPGVSVGNLSTGNYISQNSFSGNGGNAIDLNTDGVSNNNLASCLTLSPELLSLANLGLARPTLSNARLQGSTLSVDIGYCGIGVFNVELYKANAGSGDSNAGEGQQYLGTFTSLSLLNGVLANQTMTVSGLQPGDSLTAIVVDTVLGNTSEFGPNTAVTSPPSAPISAPDLTNATDSGVSNTDNNTSNNKPTFTGTCTDGETVTLYIDTVAVAPTQVCNNGTYSITVSTAIADGAHAITSTFKNATGESPKSPSLAFTIDTTTPQTPSTPDMTNGTDSGTSNADNITSDTAPSFTGSCSTGDTINLYIDNVLAGSQVCSGGTYTIAPLNALSNGNHTVTVSASDTAGNESVKSSSLSITIDTAAPVKPTTTSPSNNSTINDATPTISGNGENGTVITVKDSDGTILCTTTVSNGSWSCDTSVLGEGMQTLSITQTDAAGNTSPASTLTLTIDTTAPNAPTITAPDNASATNDSTPTISGTADANSSVTILLNSGTPVTVQTDNNGIWSYTPSSTLADGIYTVTVTQQDAAGNTSTASSNTFEVDTARPSVTINKKAGQPDPTTNNTATFTIVFSEPINESTLAISDISVGSSPNTSDAVVSSLTKINDTTWDVAITNIPNHTTVSANLNASTVQDRAGNTNTASTSTDNSVLYEVNSPNVTKQITNDSTPAIDGECIENHQLELTVNSQNYPLTCANGVWSYTLLTNLPDGTYNVVIKDLTADLTNPETNQSDALIVDTVRPSVTVNQAQDQTDPTNSNEARFTIVFSEPILASSFTTTDLSLADTTGTATLSQIDAVTWQATVTNMTSGDTPKLTLAAEVSEDRAGNNSQASTSTDNSVTFDNTPPSAPLITTPTNNSTSTNSSLTISGSGETNTKLSLYIDGTLVACAEGDPVTVTNSSWSCTPTIPIGEGEHTVTAKVADAANNSSTLSSDVTFTIDTTAPGQPSAPLLSSSSDTGASQSDNITKETKPTLTGVCTTNDTITIYDGGSLIATVTCVSNSYSATLQTSLTEGEHSLTAKATDPAGNISSPSAVTLVTVDTTTPPAATISSPQNNTTTNNTAIVISGSAESNATLTIYVDNDPITCQESPIIASAEGTWACTPSVALDDDAHTITVRQTDLAGNQSAISSTVNITIDTTAPDLLSALSLDTNSDSGVSNTDKITNDTTPTFTGSCENNTTIKLYINAALINQAACINGQFTVTAQNTLTDGSYQVQVAASDTAENTSALSSAVTVLIDTSKPATPAAPALDPASDSGASNTDKITNDTTPTFTGSCTTGNTITLYIDGSAIGQAECPPSAVYSVTSSNALSSGQHAATIIETDIAGNQSDASTSNTITIDTAAPQTPVVTSPADNTTTNNPNLVISGTGESDTVIEVLVNGNTISCAETSSLVTNGSWTCTLQNSLSDGQYTISARLVDVAGNTSANATAHTVTIDTTAPQKPATPSLTAASDTGTSASDTITNDATPTITGSCTNGETIQLVIDGTSITNVVCQNNSYELTPTIALSDGNHTITITVTDPAGNVSEPSSGLDITIVTQKPATPTADLAAPSDTGRADNDNITNDTTPTFTGSCNDSDSVVLYIDGTVNATVGCSSGNYSLTSTALSESEHVASLKTTDIAGNESNQSPTLTITIDTTAPSVPQITSPPDSAITNTTPAISGTAENQAIVVITINGSQKSCVDEPIESTSSWSCTLTNPLGDGTYNAQATAADIAGNTSNSSNTRTFTIDTVAPPTPSTPDMTNGSDSGSSNSDNITNNQQPTFTGSCTNSYRITLFIDGNQEDSVICTNNTYTLQTFSLLTNGSHSVTINTTDPAGNSSVSSTPLTITVMATPPLAPNTPELDTGSDTGHSNNDDITNETSPDFTGTCIDGMTVRLWIDGVASGQAVCTNGTYTVQPTAPLTDGTHTVQTQYIDTAGNEGAKSTAFTITIDTISPIAPTITSPPNGTTTSDNTPTVQGTGENNATPHLTINGSPQTCDASSTPVVVNNQWQCTPTNPVSDGPRTFGASQTDPAGNTSPSTTSTVTVDTSPPATLAAPDMTAGSDTGISNTDNYTSNPSPSFTGSCVSTTTLKLYANATLVAETICSNGTYTLTSQSLTNGNYSMTITATNASGVTSQPSPNTTITIDTSVAEAPGAPDMTSTTDTGITNTDNITNDQQPRFTGTCTPNAITIELRQNATTIGQSTCSNGTYDIVPAVAITEGTYNITVNSVSQSGVISAYSQLLPITIDKTAPQPPAIAVPANNALLNANKPTFSGTGEAGSTLQLYVNDNLIICNQAAPLIVSGGVWTCTPTTSLPEGQITVKASQTDPAGNTSTYSPNKTMTIDTTPPARPGRPDLTAATDSGVSNTDNVTNITTPALSGSCTNGETVRLRLNTTVITQATCTNGSYNLTVASALTSGTYSFSVVTVDLAGNISPVSLSLNVTITTTAPKPSLPDLHVDSDSGLSGTDNITNVTKPTITGTCNQNETVRITINGVFQRAVPCVPPFYAQPLDQLAPGNHNVTMEVIDIAGNLSPVSDTLVITIDTMAPGNPTVTTPMSGSTPTVTSASYQTSGTTEPNAQVIVWEGSTQKCQTIAATNGSWSCTLTALTNGTHTYTFSAVDVAGNQGAHIVTRNIFVNR